MRTLSLNQMSISGVTAVDLIEAAAYAGFSHVGLRLFAGSPMPLADDVIGDLSAARRIRQALAATGIRVAEVDHFSITPEPPLESYARVLDIACDLGATHISTTGSDPDPRRLADNLRRLCRLAADRKLTVALEFMAFRELKTLGQALALVDQLSEPNLGVLVDSLHLSRSGSDPAAVAAVAPSRIAYAQLCDAPAAIPPAECLADEARGGRLLPGEGSLWLQDFLEVLPRNCLLSIEVPNRAVASAPAKERARMIFDAVRELEIG